MKKTLLIATIPFLLEAHTIDDLFQALKSSSYTQSDKIKIEQAKSAQDEAYSKLYPKINLFAQYNNYSSPTNMLPVPPKRSGTFSNPNVAQPFSYNIAKTGISISMPIFVKSIYTYGKKAKIVQESAKKSKYINLLQNEAIIVGGNANLGYIEELRKSLDSKERSLLETKKTLQIKVDNGRTPASALYKLNDELNQIKISKDSIELQKQQIQSSIEKLTKIHLDKAVDMKEVNSLSFNNFKSLEPLEKKIEANKIEVKAQKEKFYPSIVANATYSRSMADAYNNDKTLYENYGVVGVSLNIPLYQKEQTQAITKAKLELKSSQNRLDTLRNELKVNANSLKESLEILKNSINLYKNSVENKKELLKIAKVNFNQGRLSTEEYLRYEDNLVQAKANLYKAKAQQWQTTVQLAVIYGNNIEELIK